MIFSGVGSAKQYFLPELIAHSKNIAFKSPKSATSKTCPRSVSGFADGITYPCLIPQYFSIFLKPQPEMEKIRKFTLAGQAHLSFVVGNLLARNITRSGLVPEMGSRNSTKSRT